MNSSNMTESFYNNFFDNAAKNKVILIGYYYNASKPEVFVTDLSKHHFDYLVVHKESTPCVPIVSKED